MHCLDERTEESLRLSKTKVKLEAQVVEHLDQLVAINERTAVFLALLRLPIFECFGAYPKMELASIHELFVIMLPVTFVAHEFSSKVWSPSSLNSWFFIRQRNFSLEGYATHP